MRPRQTETKKRSVLKTFTWRIIASLTTISLVYVFSNDAAVAGMVGLLEFIFKLFLYYGHERVWQRFRVRSLQKVSIFKSLSWRFIASVLTTSLALIFGLGLETSLIIGSLELFIKLLTYYIHELLWVKISWGYEKDKRKSTLKYAD
ncbi:DUF2061 domain-containing protein [Candidatus Woesearchaeota archaeon]|nr:DUF2061 domain-containing protein [Candidatus Woesearchaeota archaeon]